MNTNVFELDKNKIDSTTIIEPGAVIGKGNTIGAYTVIRANVVIGDNNYIAPHVVIGEPAEYRKHPEGKTDTRVKIGSRNRISEFVDIQSGILTPCTQIGDDCYIMVKTHIAHDCKIGDSVTIAGGVTRTTRSSAGASARNVNRYSRWRACARGMGNVRCAAGLVSF
jgi:acyl-[acyl carrier protein]--UDP-N-acetylglucosamine O-acyltransferase